MEVYYIPASTYSGYAFFTLRNIAARRSKGLRAILRRALYANAMSRGEQIDSRIKLIEHRDSSSQQTQMRLNSFSSEGNGLPRNPSVQIRRSLERRPFNRERPYLVIPNLALDLELHRFPIHEVPRVNLNGDIRDVERGILDLLNRGLQIPHRAFEIFVQELYIGLKLLDLLSHPRFIFRLDVVQDFHGRELFVLFRLFGLFIGPGDDGLEIGPSAGEQALCFVDDDDVPLDTSFSDLELPASIC